jgi:capsular exopolysaccharide synthesis family protein
MRTHGLDMNQTLDDAHTGFKADSLRAGAIWRGLRRYPALGALTVLLTVVTAAGVWLFLPLPKMTAYAVFHISSHPQALLTPVGDARESFVFYKQAQAALVKSRLVLNAALAQPELADVAMLKGHENPIGWLDRELQVEFKDGPEFMRLSLEGDNPEELKAIIEGVKVAYLKDVVNKDRAKRWGRYQSLERVQNQYEETLHNNRKKIRDIAQTLGSGEPIALAAKEKFLHEQIGTAQKDLLQVQSDMRRIQIETKNAEAKLEATDPAAVPDQVVNVAVRNDPGYQKLVAKRQGVQEAIKQMQGSMAPGARPALLVQYEADLAAIDKEMETYAGKIRPEVSKELVDSSAEQARRSLTNLHDRLTTMKELEKVILKEIDDLSRNLRTTNAGQIDVDEFKNEIVNTEKMADRIRQEMEEMRPELDAPARVTVFEEPVVIRGIEGNRRLKYSLMAGAAILALGLGFITFLEARHPRIVTTDEVSSALGMRVIGTVPSMPRRAYRSDSSPASQTEYWRHRLTECVDTTRTMLIHSVDARKCGRSLMITSAVAGEGKTLLACHLAGSLARAGYKTLLIDGDMRRPSVHNLFSINLAPGFGELLRGEATVAEALRPALVRGMSVLPAGHWDRRVMQALVNGRWKALREELQAGFDYVLVDSSPPLLVADSLLIGRHVDGVVISVLRNVSRVEFVAQARDRLTALGINVLGVVINGLDRRDYASAVQYYQPARSGAPEPAALVQSPTRS